MLQRIGTLTATNGGSDLTASISVNDAGAPVPEPGTIMLLGAGLLGLLPFRRRMLGKQA